MKTTMHSCARGYMPTVIASWHDGALAADEMDRIRAHIPTCAACQSWLAECETLDSALGAQRVPEPSARLWNDVRVRMRGTSRVRDRGRSPRPAIRLDRVARAALAVAAVALIVLSFARVLGSREGTRHPIAASTHTVAKPTGTPTPLPKLPPAAAPVAGTPVHWQPVVVPFSATDADALGFAVSATDGNTAYLCYAHPFPKGAQPAIYVTHDRGGNWALASRLPTRGNLDFAECYIGEDALNPSILAAMVSVQNVDTLKTGVLFYTSTDGGATWVAQSDIVELNGLATLGGKSYALWSQGTDISNASFPRLAVSTDGMRTWQPVDAQFSARNLTVQQFWLRPGDGALLAEVSGFAPRGTPQPSPMLWQSTDGGTRWTELPAPQLQTFVVAQPVAGQSWQICGYAFDVTNPHNANPGSLACSTGGETWVARPALRVGLSSLFIAGDGALLGFGLDSTQRTQSLVLYRLPAGSSQWESLGPEPENALFYVQNPGPGVYWSYGGGMYPGSPLSGPLGQTSYGSSIFMADYQ